MKNSFEYTEVYTDFLYFFAGNTKTGIKRNKHQNT